MTPLARQSVSDAVFQQILGRIIAGDLAPGSRLPGERVLGETLGVNRGAVREATKRLEQAGLLSIQHGGGTRVLDFRASGTLGLLTELCIRSGGRLDLGVMRSIIELRNAIFPDVARLAALRASRETGQSLRQLLDAHEQAAHSRESDRIADLQLDFWGLLARASGNLAYELMLNTLGEAYARIAPRSRMGEIEDVRTRDLAVLRRISAAVEAGNSAAAEEAARSYIVARNRVLLDGLERAMARRQDPDPAAPEARSQRSWNGTSRSRAPRRRLVSDAVFESVLERIVSGELRPGSQLPGERILGESLGANRGAVREGMKRLEQAGLVAINHGGGTRVLDFHASAALGLLHELSLAPDGTPELSVARSIVEMRNAISPDIAGLAARRAGPPIVRALESHVREHQAARGGDLKVLADSHIAFWILLAEASDNVAYQLVLNTVRKSHENLTSGLVDLMGDGLRDATPLEHIVSAVTHRDEARARATARDAIRIRTQILLEGIARAERERRTTVTAR